VEDLDEETTNRLTETALAAHRTVKLRDYGRIDMRLSPKGEVYVIEANPNPWLSSKQEFAMAAKASGRTYTQLIGEIVDLAMARYR
jgi:D-alanine-D-alanine ligase